MLRASGALVRPLRVELRRAKARQPLLACGARRGFRAPAGAGATHSGGHGFVDWGHISPGTHAKEGDQGRGNHEAAAGRWDDPTKEGDLNEKQNEGAEPELEFEDLLFGAGMDQSMEVEVKKFGKSEPYPKKAPPVSDDQLIFVDPRRLERDELVWAMGRAATLKLTEPRLWKGFAEAIEDIGESQLTPSEVCRIMQALGYAPDTVSLDEELLDRLLRAFARKAREYSDEKLVRVIYGYGKLAAKRGIVAQKFLDFATTEVIERGDKMTPFQKQRVLRAVWSLPGAGEEFRTVMMGQVVRRLRNLDSESFRFFVPMLVELKFHERPGVVDKINVVYKKKIFGWKSPELLLRSGVQLVLFDLLKIGSLVAWLGKMHDLAIPISYEARRSATPDVRQRPAGDVTAHRVTKNLEALKLVDLCLRHERPTSYAVLSAKAHRLLDEARRTELRPPEGYEMLELPFVFAELGRLARSLGFLLHPTVHGPYLLELADPLGQVVMEWDTNWALYRPWRRKQHEAFVRRKHCHLEAEGWRVLRIPLKEFQALEDKEAKLEFVNRFCMAHGLGYLKHEE